MELLWALNRGRQGLRLNRYRSSGTFSASNSKRWAVGGQIGAVGSQTEVVGDLNKKTGTVGGLT